MSSSQTLICFDLGRVLVRICDGWSHGFELAGLTGPPPVIATAEVKAALAAKVHAFEIGALSPQAFAAECGALMSQPSEVVHAILDAWIVGTTPGATQLLDDLSARGHALACLSNTNARHWEQMAAWDREHDRLWPRLGLRCASHELKLRKPDPAIYAELERRSGAAPQQIVFFDDLPENILAARARSWRAIEVRSREDPVAEMRGWLVGAGLL